ncbi:MAG: hypothetical protein E6I84_05140 [Chloroflexi bacterium]|nr:MAG: hypothetical protein E6J32_10380 [Chloroflexota bacterium]TMD66667.1 MAG: hypothetical protein E6I84_05140 [Chloroflexota bacterium]
MIRRLSFTAAGVVVVIVLVVAFVGLFMLRRPGALEGTTTKLHLETVAAVGQANEWPRPNDPHPDWVGYLPTTTWKVPANSTIQVQIDQEDGASGLRNPFWGKVFGTEGGNMHVTYFDDKGNPQEGDMTSIDPTQAAHTFAIPDLGVFVPLLGVNANAAAGSTNVITFSFKTKGPGIYRWQCFVPCAAGTLFGNGGPMQTIGYMGGTLIVT